MPVDRRGDRFVASLVLAFEIGLSGPHEDLGEVLHPKLLAGGSPVEPLYQQGVSGNSLDFAESALRDFRVAESVPGQGQRDELVANPNQIGRAHVCTPVTNAHLVCRLLLENKNTI